MVRELLNVSLNLWGWSNVLRGAGTARALPHLGFSMRRLGFSRRSKEGGRGRW